MPRILARCLLLPTLCWNLLLERILKRRRWWDRIDVHLLMGALPFASHVPALYAEGVRAVVNTCEEYAGPQAEYDRLGIVQLRIPTVDFTPPNLADLQQAVEFIRRHAADGQAVYVHCKAGRGRSATVVLCWLMAEKGLTPEQAQQWLLDKRPHVNRHLDRREVVRDFANGLNTDRVTRPAE